MATFAVGDIHGHHAALADLLRALAGEVTKDDAVVFLGDYIDRGPDSKGCIEAILAFRRTSPADVVCLCGNHEEWMLNALRDPTNHRWLLGMDGLDTVRSYSSEAAKAIVDAKAESGASLYEGKTTLPYDVFFDSMPADHLRFFENLRLSYRSADCICTHAGLDPLVEGGLDRQTPHALLWGAHGFPRTYAGTETIVYGHYHNAIIDADGWPRPAVLGKTIGIDTIAHGVLTAIRMPDQALIQSARHEVWSKD